MYMTECHPGEQGTHMDMFSQTVDPTLIGPARCGPARSGTIARCRHGTLDMTPS